MSIINFLLKKVLCCFPLKRVILFESKPDFSDNTWFVFKEMIKRNVNKKYKLIWLCYDGYPTDQKQIKNVKYLNVNKHPHLVSFYIFTAKIIVCCNRFPGCDRKKQQSFYLMHGSPIKDTSSFYICSSNIKWMITASEGMRIPSAHAMKIDENKCVALGYPRNDELTNNRIDLKDVFGNYNKIIAWYPTVKQYSGGRSIGDLEPIAFVGNEAKASLINNVLQKKNVLLVIKLHFAQVTDSIKSIEYSNIKIITNDFLNQRDITSYSFLSSVDALLTDYSSVYYDYLLCDKPIGFVWEDVELFKKGMGFVSGYEQYTSGGEKIYSLSDLSDFIIKVSDNIDLLKTERNKICDFANYSRDNLNSQRVCDFILKTSAIIIKGTKE